MSRSLSSRLCAIALAIVSAIALLGVSFEAEAQRRLGGGNFGRQSTNAMQARPATPPPATAQSRAATQQPGATSTARTNAGAAASQPARSGLSRWLGPIAGIAAGLGLAALLSHLGLGAAAAEFIGSLLLIAIVVFAVMFLFRRLRQGSRQAALQSAASGAGMQRTVYSPPPAQPQEPHTSVASAPTASTEAPAQEGSWYIPAGFNTQQFLDNAKKHFIALQDAWDRKDLERMREYMTDELLEAVQEPLSKREDNGTTEVVLLTAELLGVENVSDGHLASVRFSGMLRDGSQPEAYRFEEIWNFLKPTQGGWLLAGIQQVPVQYAR